MWDTAEQDSEQYAEHLSHDLPCVYCGHPAHRFLPCDADCGCEPALVTASTDTR